MRTKNFGAWSYGKLRCNVCKQVDLTGCNIWQNNYVESAAYSNESALQKLLAELLGLISIETPCSFSMANDGCNPYLFGEKGNVNRLKLIKQQIYGRANFDYLRRRG